MNKILTWVGVVAVGAGAYYALSQKTVGTASAAEIVIPALTGVAAAGEGVFNGTCAACHGTNLLGAEQGPPLLHAFYKPGHHGDHAFVSAIQNGSPQHHWNFGDMPAQPHIADEQIVEIIAYVRAVQAANGF